MICFADKEGVFSREERLMDFLATNMTTFALTAAVEYLLDFFSFKQHASPEDHPCLADCMFPPYNWFGVNVSGNLVLDCETIHDHRSEIMLGCFNEETAAGDAFRERHALSVGSGCASSSFDGILADGPFDRSASCGVESNMDPVALRLALSVIITIITMTVHRLCVALLTCPCLVVDASRLQTGVWHECSLACISSCRWCGRAGATVVMWITLALFALGCFLWYQVEFRGMYMWGLNMLTTYMLWFVVTVGTVFLPCRCLATLLGPVTWLTGGFVKMGRWHLERREILEKLRNRLEDVGPRDFTSVAVVPQTEAK